MEESSISTRNCLVCLREPCIEEGALCSACTRDVLEEDGFFPEPHSKRHRAAPASPVLVCTAGVSCVLDYKKALQQKALTELWATTTANTPVEDGPVLLLGFAASGGKWMDLKRFSKEADVSVVAEAVRKEIVKARLDGHTLQVIEYRHDAVKPQARTDIFHFHFTYMGDAVALNALPLLTDTRVHRQLHGALRRLDDTIFSNVRGSRIMMRGQAEHIPDKKNPQHYRIDIHYVSGLFLTAAQRKQRTDLIRSGHAYLRREFIEAAFAALPGAIPLYRDKKSPGNGYVEAAVVAVALEVLSSTVFYNAGPIWHPCAEKAGTQLLEVVSSFDGLTGEDDTSIRKFRSESASEFAEENSTHKWTEFGTPFRKSPSAAVHKKESVPTPTASDPIFHVQMAESLARRYFCPRVDGRVNTNAEATLVQGGFGGPDPAEIRCSGIAKSTGVRCGITSSANVSGKPLREGSARCTYHSEP